MAHTPQSSNCAPYAVNTSLNSCCHISCLIKEVYVVLNHNSLFMINQKSAKLIINKFIYTNDSFFLIISIKYFNELFVCNLYLNQSLMVKYFPYSNVTGGQLVCTCTFLELENRFVLNKDSNTYMFFGIIHYIDIQLRTFMEGDNGILLDIIYFKPKKKDSMK